MAIKFAELGHTVIGCGRNQKDLLSLQKFLGTPHSFDKLDVTNDKKVSQWAKKILKKYGPPDILINNAGIINKNKPLWKISANEFSDVIDINIKGVVNFIRHFVPAMVKRKSGVIINFSSGWGRFVSPEVAPYCATKFAVEGLTKSLAEELPKGMAAIPFSPGIINTQMLRSCFGGDAKNYESPEEWADHAVPFILKLSPKDNGKSISLFD